MNLTFGSPWWLLGLLSIPLLAWLRGRTGPESAFLYSSLSLVKGITELRRSRAGVVLLNLRWIALALFFIGMARPQVAGGQAPISASGIDIAVAMDLSGSMIAEDFELRGERVNRLAIAKDTLRTFVDERPADRIGLVVFGTEAFVAAPPTLDHDFLRRVIDRLELGTINGEQTAIGSGLATAVNRLRQLQSKSRIVILLTDGQNSLGHLGQMGFADILEAHLNGRHIARIKRLFQQGRESRGVINDGRRDQIEAATMGHSLPLSCDGARVKTRL
jgi:Ca-activated chloride channel family protein